MRFLNLPQNTEGPFHRMYWSLISAYCLLYMLMSPSQVVCIPQTVKPRPPDSLVSVKIAFERDGDIWGIGSDNKERRLVRNGRSPSWSWDGKRLAFLRSKSLWVVAVNKLDAPRKLCDLPPGVDDPDEEVLQPTFSWHPSFPQIVFSRFQRYVLRSADKRPTAESDPEFTLGSIWAMPSEGPVKSYEIYQWLRPRMRGWQFLGALGASHPAWAPNGRMMAYVRGGGLWLVHVSDKPLYGIVNKRVCIWDWEEEGVGRQVTYGGGTSETNMLGCAHISWRPDSGGVAYEVRRWNGSSDFWIETLTINPDKHADPKEVTLGRHPSYVPDGKRLVYSDQEDIHILDLTSRKDKVIIRNGEFPECNPDIMVWKLPAK
jgi:hypothetical protein